MLMTKNELSKLDQGDVAILNEDYIIYTPSDIAVNSFSEFIEHFRIQPAGELYKQEVPYKSNRMLARITREPLSGEETGSGDIEIDEVTGLVFTVNMDMDTWRGTEFVRKLKENRRSSVLKREEYYSHYDGETLQIQPLTMEANDTLSKFRGKKLAATLFAGHMGPALAVSFQ